ncbi:MobF family relaxase [Pseudonocardia sp.]|uniref:MobF family relaxase n=1 Tax=Pseudonocardia sp. TaxID=60912 RepID=UPI003D12642D
MLSSAKIGRSSWRYYQDSVARGACEYYAEAGNAPGRWHGVGLSELGLSAGARVEEAELEALFARGLHPGTGASLGRAWRSDAVTGHDLTFSAPKSVSALWVLADEATAAQVRAAHAAAVEAALGFLEAHASFSRRGRDGVEQIATAGLAAALFEHTTSRTGDPQLHTHALVVNKVRCTDGVWRTIDGYEVFHHKKAAGAIYQAALRTELATRLGVAFEPVTEHGQAEVSGVPDELLAAWSTRTAAVMADAIPTIAEAEEALGRPVTAAERARIVKTAVLATRPPKDHHVPEAGLRARWREQAQALGWDAERMQRSARVASPDGNGNVLAERSAWPGAVTSDGATVTTAVTEPVSTVTANGSTVTAAVATAEDSVTNSVTTVARTGVAVTDSVVTVGDSVTDSVTDSVADTSKQLFAGVDAGGDLTECVTVSVTSARAEPFAVRPSWLADAVTAVGRSGAVWSAADLTVQVAARLPATGPGAPRDAREAAAMVEALTAQALTGAAAGAVPLGADPSGVTARASDARYASREVVDTEAMVIEAVLDGLRPPRRLPTTVLHATALERLSQEQQVAAVRLVSSRDLVTVMVAPAGAGKTTVLGAAVAGWTRGGQRVLALGPSARAASELAASTGVQGVTVARFLTQQTALDTQPPTRGRPGVRDERRLRRGDVLLVDEASMLATADLAALTTRAQAAGARVVLVGDPAQIGAIRAPGGMLEHLAHLLPSRVVELSGLHRFTHAWEAAATLRLRAGDARILHTYQERDRIHPAADGDAAADAVFDRWHTAVSDGLDALMLARGWTDVTALNARARAAAIATGQVTGPPLLTATARTASTHGRPETREWRAGDVIMAKKNTPALRIGADQVRNGDRFTVLSATPDGDGLVLADLAGRGQTVLPAAYLARHSEYGWAATIDAAQGATTDIAVTLARPGLDREHLYVAMTRGRHENHLHTTPGGTEIDAGPHHSSGRPSREVDALEQLTRALATTGRERAAHSLLHPAVDQAREARFDAAEAALPTQPTPVEHRYNRDRLARALADRDHLRRRLDDVRADVERLGAEVAELPVWARRRRRDLTTTVDAARRDVDIVDAHLARAEAAVARASATVEADTAEHLSSTRGATAERRGRWQRRSDRPYRNPNLVTEPADPATTAVREPAIVAAARDVDRPSDLPLHRPQSHVTVHEPPGR